MHQESKAVSHGFARLQDDFAAAQKSLEQRLDQYRFSYEDLNGPRAPHGPTVLGFGDDDICRFPKMEVGQLGWFIVEILLNGMN